MKPARSFREKEDLESNPKLTLALQTTNADSRVVTVGSL